MLDILAKGGPQLCGPPVLQRLSPQRQSGPQPQVGVQGQDVVSYIAVLLHPC